MTEVSGVSAASVPQESVQVDASTDITQTTLPAGATIDQLPKPLIDLMQVAIAQNICNQSKRSTDRIDEILKKDQEKK